MKLLPRQEQGFTGTWLYNITVNGGAISDALALLRSLRIRPTFLAPEDLAAGALENRGFKALILAYNKAMSDAEAHAIRRFVQNGGLVIADNEPGSYSRFGKKLDRSRLSDLFPVLDREHLVQYGKGAAVYMPHTINGYLARFEKCDYAGSDSVALLLRKYAEVKTPIELIDGRGRPRRDTLMPVYLKGSARLFGLIRADTSAGKEVEDTTVKLDRAYHVWDVRESKYLGFIDSFKLSLDMYPKLFAMLPANPTRTILRATGPTVKQGGQLDLEGEIGFEGGQALAIDRLNQVAHVEVIGPDGKELEHYRDNILFDGRRFRVTLLISYSEEPGLYVIRVRHALTGMEAQANIRVRETDK